MQKMPCHVLAYLRFSISRLQFLHLKQPRQNAWFSARIARSSILFPQAEQEYVQLSQRRPSSPCSSNSESIPRRVPHVPHLKQSICHLLPAVKSSALGSGLLQNGCLPSSKAFSSSRIYFSGFISCRIDSNGIN
jgi:hypothetical protein